MIRLVCDQLGAVLPGGSSVRCRIRRSRRTSPLILATNPISIGAGRAAAMGRVGVSV
jgi:hypothetical protein